MNLPMHCNQIAISVHNLSKTYRIFEHPGERLKQLLAFGRKRYHKEFAALKNVSFNVQKGEVLGIVGCNGSGKSTLLQLVCGILKPTSGSVEVHGRISALLELGAGFNPEFTGRENVYFQGALIGLSEQEIDDRFDDIASFADIGEFINQPVRTYSSGMFVRLAFATAVHVDADILVVDEALAVGDAGFRSRCFQRIGKLRNAGCTVLFVSHSMEQVSRLCGKVLLLDQGEMLLAGPPGTVTKQFQRLMSAVPATRQAIREQIKRTYMASLQADTGFATPTSADDIYDTDIDAPPQPTEYAVPYTPNGAFIENVRIVNAKGLPVNELHTGMTYRCLYRVHFTREVSNVRYALLIKTPEGVSLSGTMSAPSLENTIPTILQNSVAEVEFEFECLLNPATYFLSVAVFSSEAKIEYTLHGIQAALMFRVASNSSHHPLGAVDLSARVVVHIADTMEK